MSQKHELENIEENVEKFDKERKEREKKLSARKYLKWLRPATHRSKLLPPL